MSPAPEFRVPPPALRTSNGELPPAGLRDGVSGLIPGRALSSWLYRGPCGPACRCLTTARAVRSPWRRALARLFSF